MSAIISIHRITTAHAEITPNGKGYVRIDTEGEVGTGSLHVETYTHARKIAHAINNPPAAVVAERMLEAAE